MSHSPHLPPKACSVPAYYVRQSLPWIFVVVTIAMLSGIAAGLATAAWFLPSFQTDATGTIRGGNKQLNIVAPDVLLQKTVSQRVLTIYDKRLRSIGGTYAQTAAVGQAVVLSSDGWLVTQRTPAYKSNDEKFWELIDFQGIVYKPTEVIVDPVMHLTYIHIAVDGLPIISFRQQPRVQAGDMMWAWSPRGWERAIVGQPTLAGSVPDVIFRHAQQHEVSENIPVGAFLTDERGHLSGIVNTTHRVIDIDAIQRQLAPLLQDGALKYSSPSWSGYLVEGERVDEVYKRQAGFLIVNAKALLRGDIVTVIDGQLVKPVTFSSIILDAPETFSAVVIRDGREIVVEITKEDIDLDALRKNPA